MARTTNGKKKSAKSAKDVLREMLLNVEDNALKRAPNRKPPKPAVYREAIVTFIDILGFRNLVKNRPASEIGSAIRLLQRHLAGDDRDFNKSERAQMNWVRALYFSDSVVHVRPFDGPYAEGAFFYQIHQLLLAQFELAARGIFIRGGLTVGEIYAEDGVLFGPAMVRAYDLESKFANYPRIIVDPKALAAYKGDPRLKSDDHTLSQDSEYIANLLRRGDDGLYFIDYLGQARFEMDDPDHFPHFLEVLKRKVMEEVTGAKGDLAITQKYLWLARYINSVARRFTDCKKKTMVFGPSDFPELAPVRVSAKKSKRR